MTTLSSSRVLALRNRKAVTRALRILALAALIGVCLFGTKASGANGGFVETDLVVDQLVNNVPTLTDKNGIVHIAKFFDPHLVNPWGISESQASPFWVSDNGAGVSTLYNTGGTPQALVVSIPTPSDRFGAGGTPTGQAFNIAGGPGGAFQITGVSGTGTPTTAAAVFLFATEDGTIAGWNPGVNPPGFDPPTAGKHAIIAVDNSANPDPCHGAIYKGLAIATDAGGNTHLYAANFRAGTIEVYDSSFQPVSFSPDAFTDPHLPHRYAPFNVVPVGLDGTTELVVTYAEQGKAKEDDVAGPGHGIVDIFDLSGHLLRRFAQHQELNSPWGVALAPASFVPFGGALLIGNFGNGRINAFDVATGAFLGSLKDAQGHAIVIDGLWALKVGNGGNGGDANTLYFTAGPNDESDGLFGSIAPQ
jgi:uncharacterized protein (TIGR03118 family)